MEPIYFSYLTSHVVHLFPVSILPWCATLMSPPNWDSICICTVELVISTAVHEASVTTRPQRWIYLANHTSSCNLRCWLAPNHDSWFGTELWSFIIWGTSLMHSMVKSSIPINPWESINNCVGPFPSGFCRSRMTQMTSMVLKYMFYCSNRNKIMKTFVASLVTFTNTRTNFPFICAHYFS